MGCLFCTHLKRKADIILVVLVATAAIAILVPRTEDTPFHGDESGWISSAYHYTDLIRTFDFTPGKWQCGECGAWGSLNLHVGQWLIGVPLVADPQIRGRRFSGYYDFDLSLEDNTAQGRVPPRDILLKGRRAVAVVGVLCCLLVFAIGDLAYGPAVGVLAAVLLLTNRLFVVHATRTLTDVHYSFFLLASCLAVMLLARLGRARSFRAVAAAAATAGVLVGLATSVKVTAIVIGSLMYVGVVYAFVDRTARLVATVAFCASIILVIYGLNPYFWIDASDLKPRTLIQEIGLLSREVRTSSVNIESAPARFPQVFHLARFPLVFVRWNRLMNSQLQNPAYRWNGSRIRILHENLLFRYASFRGEWLFLAVGVSLAAVYGTSRTPSAVALIYLFVNYGFILVFMKLNWERYYLPTVIAIQLFAAFGVIAVATLVLDWLRRARQPRKSVPASATAKDTINSDS
jgi:hypothetical protein